MARINIEDKIWADSRFKALITCLGGEEVAIGRLVRAWRIAQEWWTKDQQLIPESIWDLNGLGQELFQVMLARKTDDGIYVSGATEQFLWLIAKKRAGKASGVSRRNKKKIEHNDISVRTQDEQSGVKIEPPTLSPSLPLSPTLSQKKEKREASPPETRQLPLPDKKSPSPVEVDSGWAVGVFCREYKRRYGTSYRVTGKDVQAIKRILKDLGKPVFEKVCVAYVDMPDPWFVTRRHDVITLESNIAKVSQFEQSGKNITQTQIREMDRRATNQELIKAAERGEI